VCLWFGTHVRKRGTGELGGAQEWFVGDGTEAKGKSKLRGVEGGARGIWGWWLGVGPGRGGDVVLFGGREGTKGGQMSIGVDVWRAGGAGEVFGKRGEVLGGGKKSLLVKKANAGEVG